MEKVSRRSAIKIILAAAGGMGAAAFLPAKWVKPIIKAGVIPAHAQGSSYNISAKSYKVVYAYTPTISSNSSHKHLAIPAIPPLGIPFEGASITFVDWDLTKATKGSDWDAKKGTHVITDVSGDADFGLEFPVNDEQDAIAVLHYRAANGKTVSYTISNWP